MLHSYLVWSTLALSLVPHAVAFAPNHLQRQQTIHDVARTAVANPQENELGSGSNSNNNGSNEGDVSRRSMFSIVAAIAALPLSAKADDEVDGVPTPPPAVPSYSIKKCPTPSTGPCISTSNVRQLDLYAAPWTFTVSPDEVMSRLKGAIIADTSCEIVQQDGIKYLKAQAKRSDLFGTMDEFEFVINADDQVVTFRSAAVGENSSANDLGANKRRLEEIRKRTGIFAIMGANMDSADSKTYSERGYGPLGQLKAFYGLQSGGGFEDVVRE